MTSAQSVAKVPDDELFIFRDSSSVKKPKTAWISRFHWNRLTCYLSQDMEEANLLDEAKAKATDAEVSADIYILLK